MFWTKNKRNIQEELRERCRKRCKGVELCGNCKRYRKYVKRYGKELQPVDCFEEVAVEMIYESKKKKNYQPPAIEISHFPKIEFQNEQELDFNAPEFRRLFGQ